MIVRLWRGWAHPDTANAYAAFLQAEISHGFLAEGVRGVEVLRRPVGDEVEFVTLTRFDGWAAVEAFAGPDLDQAVVPAEAQRLLSRWDGRVAHYEHFDVMPPLKQSDIFDELLG